MRDFVSVTEKLQCGSPVQATASPRSVPASSGSPISASRRSTGATSATSVSTKFCWRVMRTSWPSSASAII